MTAGWLVWKYKFSTVKRTCVILLTSLATWGWSEPKVANFTGRWVLDNERSESVEPLLEAHGIPAPQRRLLAKMKVSLEVEQSSGQILIKAVTPILTDTELLKTDGTRQERSVPYLGLLDYQSEWTDEGRVLVTHSKARQSHLKGNVRRYLSPDGDLFIHEATAFDKKGKRYDVRRVFRRSHEGSAKR